MKADLASLPGRAEYGGYVYVACFSSGLVKVGRTQDARGRVTAHQKDARTFGLTLADWWVSPLHAEWLENEDALIETAHVLGGVPVSPEYFNGLDFAAITGKAHDLPFTPPDAASGKRARSSTPEWLKRDLAKYRAWVREDISDAGEVADYLADRILSSDREFGRVIIARHLRRRLTSEAEPVSTPEPPEPGPPDPDGLVVADILTALERAA